MAEGAPRASEDGLIARYFAPLAGPGADGMRDDAATLTPSPGCDLVLTADAIVAGIHYFPEDPPGSIARKALGVNLSDIAAKGAVPRGFLLTLALPDDWTEGWLAAFTDGLGVAAQAAGCPLLGGDTVRSGGPALVGV
ncbi:MAG: thiamine-phosphate kinase, partial [Actinomycetospora chiangmaiensis]|nr:thiamine-phosphate kinase [Actinomycetospora chiangmaiensis]